MKTSILFLLMGGLGLTGCGSRIDTNIKPQYEKKAQIPLSVASVNVRYDFNPTLKTSRTDHLFSRSLTQGLERWVHTRLRPVGQFGVAQLIVRDASIIALPDYRSPEKVQGTLDAILVIFNAQGVIVAQSEAKVKREEIAPPHMSEQEEQELSYVLATKLIDAFNKQMEETLMRLVSSVPLSSPRTPGYGGMIGG